MRDVSAVTGVTFGVFVRTCVLLSFLNIVSSLPTVRCLQFGINWNFPTQQQHSSCMCVCVCARLCDSRTSALRTNVTGMTGKWALRGVMGKRSPGSNRSTMRATTATKKRNPQTAPLPACMFHIHLTPISHVSEDNSSGCHYDTGLSLVRGVAVGFVCCAVYSFSNAHQDTLLTPNPGAFDTLFNLSANGWQVFLCLLLVAHGVTVHKHAFAELLGSMGMDM